MRSKAAENARLGSNLSEIHIAFGLEDPESELFVFEYNSEEGPTLSDR
jgi:hypothetical protein